MRLVSVITLFGALSVACSSHAEAPPPVDADLGSYALDALSRTVAATGPMRCPAVPRGSFTGERVRWKTPLSVHPAFAERLARFEAVVVEVATQVYGRAPKRMAHLGSYNCRRIRLYPDLLSEHGVANAVDLSAFEFDALPRGAAAPDELPKALRRAFRVTVLDHWTPKRDDAVSRLHRRFLVELTDRLVARGDIFRVLLGPAYPGHKDHFHFDCAPYRLVVL
jgi:hypothetical protein